MKNFYAIIMGVGGDLPETENDANAIKNIFVDPSKGGYDRENVTYLVNAESTKDKIIEAFNDLIEKTKQIEDATIVIYYSGHGNRYLEGENYVYYLKTHGSDLSNKEATMLNGDLFTEKINDLNAEKLLVMLDCCHAEGMNSGFNHRALQQKLKQGRVKTILSSCDDDEKSAILPDASNSLFTAVALEVLEGATLPNNEYIGALDLICYVLREVPARLAKYNHPQHPLLTAERLSDEYNVCKNGRFTSQKEDSADSLLSKIDGGLAKDPFTPHSKAASDLTQDDIKNVDAFFENINYYSQTVSYEIKKDFIKQIGGMNNLEAIQSFIKPQIGSNGIKYDIEYIDIFTHLNRLAENQQKLNFINSYPYTV